jgi:Lar family restriction alleviation protein
MSKELKPCPCCGKGDADLERISTDQTYYTITCIYCGLNTNLYASEAEAINAWNNRHDGWISVGDRLPEMGRFGSKHISLELFLP